MKEVLTFSSVFGPFLLGFQVCLIPEIPEPLPLFPCNLLEKKPNQTLPYFPIALSQLFPSSTAPTHHHYLYLCPWATTSGVCGEHLPPTEENSGKCYCMEKSRNRGRNCFLPLVFSRNVWEEHSDLFCLFFFASQGSASRP